MKEHELCLVARGFTNGDAVTMTKNEIRARFRAKYARLNWGLVKCELFK